MKLTPEHIAWDILREAEGTDFLMSMAQHRAACGNFSAPKTPGDYLVWFEAESEIAEASLPMEAQAKTYPNKAEKPLQYATVLREVADRLRDLGYEPAVLEQEKPDEALVPISQILPAPFDLASFKQRMFDFVSAGS